MQTALVEVFHLMASDTPRWSEDDSGGVWYNSGDKMVQTAGLARSMRDVLPCGLTCVKEGTTFSNEKLYKISLRCENK